MTFPISTVCTVLMDGNRMHTTSVKNMVKQWYWCGVFGELYGSANETRHANDIVQVVKWINDDGDLPKTVTDFYFKSDASAWSSVPSVCGIQGRDGTCSEESCP